MREFTLRDLECIDCEGCGAVGRYRRLGPNRFECKECGTKIIAEPCDCHEPRAEDTGTGRKT